MKKLISISLVLVLAGGLILAENKRAEAIDPASAALIGASIMLLPILGHISHEHDYYGHAPYYSGAYPAASYDGPYYANPYPIQTRVIYRTPRYDRNYGQYWGRGQGYERGWQDHRGHRQYSRDSGHERGRYSNRY